jgi:hypothetical protein
VVTNFQPSQSSKTLPVILKNEMKKVLFITLLLILSKSYSQTKYDIFDELIVKADSLKKIEDYKLALKKYNEALKVLTPNSSTPFFDAAFSSIKLNNKRNAKK